MGLTGTLVNGYADGVYYILYRMFASYMKKEGFEWEDRGAFQEAYGVTEQSQSWRLVQGRRENSKTKKTALPGVSPLVFTQFLLDNAVFFEMSDMAEGLPGYQEIPVAVEMDNELRAAYETYQADFRRAIGSPNGHKILGELYSRLCMYPDQPHDHEPVYHSDTGEIMVRAELLPDVVRNKENRLVSLVQERITAGDKVMVYCNWTNTTQCMQRLAARLNQEGIRSAILTSSVSARERETWITRQMESGVQVLFTNPELVKTGLDLLDFTSIIFYQIGQNLYTVRQASRRSYRLSQINDVRVYFLYYRGTVQERATSLMATKLQAAMSVEGKFSEEGLQAMSNNMDFLTQIANSVVHGALSDIDESVFEKSAQSGSKIKRAKRARATSHVSDNLYSLLSFRSKHRRQMSGWEQIIDRRIAIPAC